MRTCLGDPLGHSLRPYITMLNFLSTELTGRLLCLVPLGSLLKDWACEEELAELLACFKVAAYVSTLVSLLLLLVGS